MHCKKLLFGTQTQPSAAQHAHCCAQTCALPTYKHECFELLQVVRTRLPPVLSLPLINAASSTDYILSPSEVQHSHRKQIVEKKSLRCSTVTRNK
mmetsp:Transcript_8710/g.23419  ORF Transcript_8710/g.23419 Transcript_8710/m.23419 type:complete len:95 (+) Transcript_8710:428-712(+)